MNELSIYIHWPFCLSKCPYCDFNSHVQNVGDYGLWLECYKKELDYFADIIGSHEIKSIFFGGGTPSLMEPFIIEGIINKIAKISRLSSSIEITLEANPTSFEFAKFKSFKNAGVNRISIGVQAFKEDNLKYLGREHSAKDAVCAIEAASNIFSPERCSFDLIYALPKQSLKEWQDELAQAINFRTGHISLYQLTIEKGTPFYKLHKEGAFSLPESDQAADMQEWTDNFLKENNYYKYEISNYATSGHECVHNLTYWNYRSYLGIGPGAHSRIHKDYQTRSLMMWHKPDKWLSCVKELTCGIQVDELLKEKEVAEEFLMMGLRLTRGVDLKQFEKLAKENIENLLDHNMIRQYILLGFITLSDKYLKLTDKGLMLHNYILPRILKE